VEPVFYEIAALYAFIRSDEQYAGGFTLKNGN